MLLRLATWAAQFPKAAQALLDGKAAVMPIIEDKVIYGSNEPFRPADQVILHKTPWQLAARLDK